MSVPLMHLCSVFFISRLALSKGLLLRLLRDDDVAEGIDRRFPAGVDDDRGIHLLDQRRAGERVAVLELQALVDPGMHFLRAAVRFEDYILFVLERGRGI